MAGNARKPRTWRPDDAAGSGRHRPLSARALQVGESVSYRSCIGRIVANIDSGECEAGTSWSRLAPLCRGVVVRWNDGTLGHFREPLLCLARLPPGD
jgi:hypothetical protein